MLRFFITTRRQLRHQMRYCNYYFLSVRVTNRCTCWVWRHYSRLTCVSSRSPAPLYWSIPTTIIHNGARLPGGGDFGPELSAARSRPGQRHHVCAFVPPVDTLSHKSAVLTGLNASSQDLNEPKRWQLKASSSHLYSRRDFAYIDACQSAICSCEAKMAFNMYNPIKRKHNKEPLLELFVNNLSQTFMSFSPYIPMDDGSFKIIPPPVIHSNKVNYFKCPTLYYLSFSQPNVNCSKIFPNTHFWIFFLHCKG